MKKTQLRGLSYNILNSLVGLRRAESKSVPLSYRLSYIRSFGFPALIYHLSHYYHTAKRLKKKGLVKIHKTGPNIELQITRKGISFFDWLESKSIPKDKIKKWDGHWRLVIFDIPEKSKKLRNILRANLKRFGFVHLQKSAWVFPHECRAELVDLCRELKIFRYVTLFEGNYLGNDKSLRCMFKI